MKWKYNNKIDDNVIGSFYISPQKILKYTGDIGNPNAILSQDKECSVLKWCSTDETSIIVDFGQEINGGIMIETGWPVNDIWSVKCRLRFGESVSEVINTPNNNHSIHDLVLEIPLLGKTEFGNTGFRFFRLDILQPDAVMKVKEISAIVKERPFDYKGNFECSNKMFNKIWLTGARTVHLCCQDVIYDGIKRDRLLWVGDLHPQINVIKSVFGPKKVVQETLIKCLETQQENGWMNGICSYTLWWLICVAQWYQYTGDMKWLAELKTDFIWQVKRVLSFIDENGKESYTGWRFIDWVVEGDDRCIDQSLHYLSINALSHSLKVLTALDAEDTYAQCFKVKENLLSIDVECSSCIQAASLAALANIYKPQISGTLSPKNIDKQMSTWYGYYLLEAFSQLGHNSVAMNLIEEYWGGMLELGATTFWEHFNVNWLNGACRIDEIPQTGRNDVHKDYGEHCFDGLRKSLCHGWAAGPTAWMTENVLGIKILEAGCKKISINPNLGSLEFARGAMPLPNGLLEVEILRGPNNRYIINHNSPDNTEVMLLSPEATYETTI